MDIFVVVLAWHVTDFQTVTTLVRLATASQYMRYIAVSSQ